MSYEVTDCNLPPFQQAFYYLMKILFLDGNFVSPQLNLKHGRYKQSESMRTSKANKRMEVGCGMFPFLIVLPPYAIYA